MGAPSHGVALNYFEKSKEHVQTDPLHGNAADAETKEL